MLAGLPPAVLIASALFVLGLLTVVFVIVAPGPQKLSWERRRPGSEPEPTMLSRAAGGIMNLIVRAIGRRGAGGADLLEEAGIQRRWQEFASLLIIGTVVAGAVGLLVGGILVALVLAIAVPLVTRLWLGARIRRRQRAFADQLEDSLQLLASSLRAGHSMLQALSSVAREAESPTSEEFARIINQTRVGREVGEALEETSRRMQSDDFSWVTQAIAINREVGGNLAEVLDAVGATIRERAQIRGQVKSLAAEGKISAYVLVALPLGVTAFLLVTQPAYLAPFTSGLLGYGLIGLSILMMVAGTLWLRKVITIKF